jgi:predicted nucleotidyltransferase
MGRIVPEMGTSLRPTAARGLAGALFTPVQQRVLALLFGQPERTFGSGELIRAAGSGTGAAHRQLLRLERAALVTATRVGNQKRYRANPDSPIFAELHGLVVKTVGLVEPLRAALAPLADGIAFAFVFGSIAKGDDRAGSDVDLLVVSDEHGYLDLHETLQGVEGVLSRTINPTVLNRAEWRAKSQGPDSFVRRIAGQQKLFVLGSEHDLG